MRLILLVTFFASAISSAHPLPGTPSLAEIELPEDLGKRQKDLLQLALESAAKFKLNNYLFGSADPSRGGFDCSGSVFYLLKKIGIDPPRTSAGQFEWVKQAGKLVEVPPDTAGLDDPIFAKLKPGDLLFWSGTYTPTDGRPNKITHVQIYLGKEKKDLLPVMIGSSDGRSYRGSQRTGFGVYNFKLPRPTSKSRFIGYGTPPELVDQ